MVDRAPSGAPSPDPRGDGVRIIQRDRAEQGSSNLKWVAALLIAVCVVSGAVLFWPNTAERHGSADSAATDIGADGGDMPSGAGIAEGGNQTSAATNATRLAASDDISNYIPQGEAPPMAEVIERLNKAGVHTGLGAFSPPGTSPPMVGLAVPEAFDLPEGYVRHYQATDDGQRIDPILMFSPDFEFLDAAGQPLALPANMVVPPHMAPPGLPLHLIKIPPPLAAQGSPA